MKKIFMYFLMVLSALSFSSCKIKPKGNRTYPNFKARYFDSGIIDEKDPNQRVYYIVACKGETYQVINDIKLDIQASLAPLHATTKEEDLEKYKNDVDKTTKIYIDTNNEKHKIHELPFLIVDTDYGSIHIDCRIKFNNTNTISIPREYLC